MSRVIAVGFLILFSLSVCGCSRSPKPSFYVLAPEAAPQPPIGKWAYSVFVGPVTVPEVVDRPQLVVRTGPNSIDILENHRWGEPLKYGLPRLIAMNLGQLLPARVSAYPESAEGADFNVQVEIGRLESAPGEYAAIEAQWTVKQKKGEAKKGSSSVKEPVRGGGYDPVVAALSRGIATISGEIARVIAAEVNSSLAIP